MPLEILIEEVLIDELETHSERQDKNPFVLLKYEPLTEKYWFKFVFDVAAVVEFSG